LHEPYQKPAITAGGAPTTKKIEIGKYKTQPNHLRTATGETFYFATPEETPAKMHDLMAWLEEISKEKDTHPLLIAAWFHYKFIRIHPFDDGNGRLARMLMNLVLMKYGFPPAIIKTEKKQEYFTALRQADGGDETAFVAYTGEQLLHSWELYLKGAKGENIEEDDDIDKEIKLLKAQLKGEEAKEKIFMDSKYVHQIYHEQVKVLLTIVLNKLAQFDDLFHKHYINIDLKGITISLDKNHLDEKNLIEALNHAIQTNYDLTNLAYLRIIYHFENFKNVILPFDYMLDFRIDFNKYFFRVSDKKYEMLYYQNNETIFKEIANSLAKNILEFIKSKI
jgi:fido (protein-threonine AMPylation protein)